MIKNVHFFAAVVLLGLTLSRLSAQTSTGALEVIARNGADKDVHLASYNGVVPMVLVRPNQIVPVTLQFPSDKAGTPLVAMPLDGGEVNGGRLVVLPTGKVVFTFKPVPVPGHYRLVVRTPGEEHLLEFYVVDPAHPPQQQLPWSSQ